MSISGRNFACDAGFDFGVSYQAGARAMWPYWGRVMRTWVNISGGLGDRRGRRIVGITNHLRRPCDYQRWEGSCHY